ncbi:MAG: peptide chain release factor 2, partial [Fusobacterium sp.]|nr:peptide chain release factor 2 [Fusobacterium sp.]
MKILGGLFDIERRQNTIKESEKLTMEEGFWGDKRKSSEIIKNINFEKNILEKYNFLVSEKIEEELLIDFLEAGEESFEEELLEKHNFLKKDTENF